MNIGFIGINSQSVSYSIKFDLSGHCCFLYDSDTDLVFNLNNKVFLSDESKILENLVNTKNIYGSTDVTEVIKNSDIIFSFIDCELNANNTINISPILDQIQSFYLASHLNILLYGKHFILSTTLNPGDSKKIYEKISQFGINFGILPNFLTEGQTYNSIINNNMYVLGTNSQDLSTTFTNLIRSINSNPKFYIMSFESAELIKLCISAITANKIVVANLLGDFMTSMGLKEEIPLVMSSISEDPKVGKQNMNYGLGYEETNLGKEMKVLSEFAKNKKIEINIFNDLERANQEHLNYLKYYYMTLNPNKSTPFIIDSLGLKKNNKNTETSQKFKLCIELLQEGYIVNVIENLDIANKFTSLSESFSNRLKFFKKGTNPEGVIIK